MAETKEPTKVGFLESDAGRKSNNRLTVLVVAFICVWAALVEGGCKVVSVIKQQTVVEANWESIAYLVAVTLLGATLIKAAQRTNINVGKSPVSNDNKTDS